MDLPFDVIDTHVHLYPDKIAEKVTLALSAKFGNPPRSLQPCRLVRRLSGCRFQTRIVD